MFQALNLINLLVIVCTNHFYICWIIIKCSGYVPPEYVSKGVYSTKSDVYSFGVLLLQIISGKKNACFYGSEEDLNLLEYVSIYLFGGKLHGFISKFLQNQLCIIIIPYQYLKLFFSCIIDSVNLLLTKMIE